MKHKLKCPACGCTKLLMSSEVDFTAEIVDGVVKKQKDSISEEIIYACCADCGKCLTQVIDDELCGKGLTQIIDDAIESFKTKDNEV